MAYIFQLLKWMVFFWEIYVFLTVCCICLFGTNKPISTLKTMICRNHTLQKLTQFSVGKNVLDTTASNRDGCLWRDTCVSPNQLNRPIWNKMSLSAPWKLRFSTTIPFKLYALVSHTGGFVLRDTRIPSSEMNRPICIKQGLHPPFKVGLTLSTLKTMIYRSIPCKN
jgi:hypothetical protein